MNSASFYFHDILNDFLPKNLKNTKFLFNFKSNPSVKDCIESIGIPHTEIEAIKLNSVFTDFDAQINDNDNIEVFSVNSNLNTEKLPNLRPQIIDFKFIVDANVAKITKNLRMLGFDTYYDFDLPDKDIVALAEREKRIILSRDIGLLKRKNAIFGYFVRSTNIEDQIVEVINRYKLFNKINPFSLCLECNNSIQIATEEAKNSLDKNILDEYNEFFKCENCNKFFWKGSHYDKMLLNINKWTKNDI